MRVSFLGKGGSGKTTTAVAFIKYLESKGEKVLAIDADMNVHLGKTLDMPILTLEDKYIQIEDFLEGKRTNKVLSEKPRMPIIGTTPPSCTSTFITTKSNDKFLDTFSTKKDNITLLTIGTYNSCDIGTSCYHGKLGVAELILNRMLDTEKDYIVIDGTAGVDSLGSSMFFVGDVNIFIIEPTEKSLAVFNDFEKISQNLKLDTYVIVNKVDDEEDKEFIESRINKNKILGFINYSKKLKKAEQGHKDVFTDFNQTQAPIFDKLIEILKIKKRDWNKYYQKLLELYTANSLTWYNAYYGEDLLKYIDKDFSYEKVIKND